MKRKIIITTALSGFHVYLNKLSTLPVFSILTEFCCKSSWGPGENKIIVWIGLRYALGESWGDHYSLAFHVSQSAMF